MPGTPDGKPVKLPAVTRGVTAKDRLRIDWRYPVYAPPQKEVAPGESVAAEIRRSLPLERAFAEIAGDDRRPLLVLRECLRCSGTDDALLHSTEDNERTMLMTRWFHCVKLSPDVLDEGHAFGNLFEGEEPPHLFVARWNGEGVKPLTGAQSRRELWQVMEERLRADYERDPARAVSDLLGVLSKYDLVDQKLDALRNSFDDTLEKDGPDSKKLAKIQREIEKCEEQRKLLRGEEDEISDLSLRKSLEGAAAGAR
jgi:hypothetical protein